MNILFPIVLAVLLTALAGCTSTQSVAPLDVAIESSHVPLEEEVWAIGQADSLHAALLAKGMVSHNKDADRLFSSVKHRLLSDQPKIAEHIRIYLLRSPEANAAALPNGVIYINAGLFPILENEDQLAAIIGHEIAHIVGRHSLRAVITQKNTFIGAHVADLMTGGLGLAYIPALASLSSFSRDQEQQADVEALVWLQEAGYRPEAAVEVFENFKTVPGAEHNEGSIYSSHPSQDKRIENLEQQLPAAEPVPSAGPAPSPEFLKVRITQSEAVVRMHLRDHRYILAETDLDRIEVFIPAQSRIQYYRGEVYFGRAQHPGDATREAHWIETGNSNFAAANFALMEDIKEQNLELAILHYTRAASEAPRQADAMKRLGEVYLYQGNSERAIYWLEHYLSMQPGTGDARYAQSLLDKARKQT